MINNKHRLPGKLAVTFFAAVTVFTPLAAGAAAVPRMGPGIRGGGFRGPAMPSGPAFRGRPMAPMPSGPAFRSRPMAPAPRGPVFRPAQPPVFRGPAVPRITSPAPIGRGPAIRPSVPPRAPVIRPSAPVIPPRGPAIRPNVPSVSRVRPGVRPAVPTVPPRTVIRPRIPTGRGPGGVIVPSVPRHGPAPRFIAPEPNFNQFRGSEFNRQAEQHFHRPRFEAGLFFYNVPQFSGSFYYGYWGFGTGLEYPYYLSSPFFYFGLPYVYAPRVVIVSVPTYSYEPVPFYYVDQGPYIGLGYALDNIRSAWLNGDFSQMLPYIRSNRTVAIYLNGQYDYSLNGFDYREMTRDAIDHTRTVDFTFDRLERRSDGAFTAYGTQDFYDVDGNYRTIYVSYTLALSHGNWYIVAAGSSESPYAL